MAIVVRRHLERAAERLTLRQLRAFVVLAEVGAFTQAAARLHMSQSNLRSAIRVLEENIGTRLFDRQSRSITMTPEGAGLLPDAKRILTELALLVEGVVDQQQKSTVRIAAIPAVAGDLLPHLLEVISDRLPDIRIEVLDEQRPKVFGSVRSGLADFGIALGRATPPDLLAHPFLKEDLLLVCRPDHPLAAKSVITYAELLEYPLIGPTREQLFYAMLSERFFSERLPLHIRYEVTFVSTFLGLVAQGLGIAFAYGCMRSSIKRMGLTYRSLAAPSISYEFSIVVPRSRPLAFAASKVRRVILELPAEVILRGEPDAPYVRPAG
jgi:LysR family carnitine catabolism transcriptional activator